MNKSILLLGARRWSGDMRSLAFLGAAIAGVLWSTSGFAGVNLVQNPGFETGDITDWTEAGNWGTPYNHVTTSGYLST